MASPSKRAASAAGYLEQVDSLIRVNRYKEALAKLENPPAGFDPGIPCGEAAFYQYLLGFTLWRLGEKKRALGHGRRALDYYLNLREFAGIAKSENLVGSVLIDLGNLKEAKELLELAVGSFKHAKDWSSAARALNKVSYLYSIRGMLKQAIQFDEEAKECADRANDRHYAGILEGHLAFYQLLLGGWKNPLEALRRFVEASKKSNDFPSLSIGLLYCGYADLLRGRTKIARRNYLEAVSLCLDHGLVGTLKIAYEYLGELCIKEGHFNEAGDYLNRSFEIGEKVSPYGTIMTQTWRLMGDMHNAKGEYHQALEAYHTCESYLVKLPEELERGACLVGKGLAYARLEEWSAARPCFEKALDVFAQCENDWEMAKSVTAAAEAGVYSAKQVKGQLFWAREIFQKLEHPAWEKRVEELLASPEVGPLNGVPLRSEKAHLERERVLAALEEAEGNRTKTAEILKIPRTTLCSILKRINGSK